MSVGVGKDSLHVNEAWNKGRVQCSSCRTGKRLSEPGVAMVEESFMTKVAATISIAHFLARVDFLRMRSRAVGANIIMKRVSQMVVYLACWSLHGPTNPYSYLKK